MSLNEFTIEASGPKRIGKSRLFAYGLSWFQAVLAALPGDAVSPHADRNQAEDAQS
jgi:hypothetical protein